MKLSDKKILVVGLAKTGLSVARFCRYMGARVTVTDRADPLLLQAAGQELTAMGVELELGEHRLPTFEQADLIILSPGVPHTIPPLERVKKQHKPIWSEIELAARFIREPMAAVTGTNGKTTTTTLLGKMLENAGLKAFVGGNIGTPLIDYVHRGEKADVVVVEASSFQLDTIKTFRPRVGILLNITEDHQDRYVDFTTYVQSKARIFKNQSRGDYAIFNAADPRVCAAVGMAKSRKLPISLGKNGNVPTGAGAGLSGSKLTLQLEGLPPSTLDLSGLKLPGRHNRENVAAAGLAALCMGGSIKGVHAALESFEGLPHRVEYIGTWDGVRYYNDSKATNVDAVAKALACFSEPLVLIMCGRDKGGDFAPLKRSLGKKTIKIVVFGEATDIVQNVFSPVTRVKPVSDMAEAVSEARRSIGPGGVVLLSPGCDSFDMYTSYAHRGMDFTTIVRGLGRVS